MLKYIAQTSSILIFSSSISYSFGLLPKHLISFSSYRGMQYIQRNKHSNSLKLLEHFTTQKYSAYCGIASAVMILNAIKHDVPLDEEHCPFHYFTQDNFFNKHVSKIISEELVQKNGITLMQLYKTIQQFGVSTKVIYANEISESLFRAQLKYAIQHKQYVIVNFLRSNLQQAGEGHFSPIAAYDEISDRFLVLEVARYKYPPFWVKTSDLWRAIDTKDGNFYRGFIITSSPLQT